MGQSTVILYKKSKVMTITILGLKIWTSGLKIINHFSKCMSGRLSVRISVEKHQSVIINKFATNILLVGLCRYNPTPKNNDQEVGVTAGRTLVRLARP